MPTDILRQRENSTRKSQRQGNTIFLQVEYQTFTREVLFPVRIDTLSSVELFLYSGVMLGLMVC